MNIKIKRVYDAFQKEDGIRILVDRLWPRGLTKEKANIDLWIRDIAPSTALRKWFKHDPEKWKEFQKRYRKELESKTNELETIRQEAMKHPVTLVYGAKDERYNDAVVLEQLLNDKDM